MNGHPLRLLLQALAVRIDLELPCENRVGKFVLTAQFWGYFRVDGDSPRPVPIRREDLGNEATADAVGYSDRKLAYLLPAVAQVLCRHSRPPRPALATAPRTTNFASGRA